jgi:L-threonylcarbamoyladenylate synthase
MEIPTRVIRVEPLAPDPSALAEAAVVLRAGGLVAFPTETVYGLGAVATNPGAVRRIYRAKGRPSTNPLIVHVSGAEMAREYVAGWPEAADRLATALWPGPLTLVLPRAAIIPDEITGGLGTVGLRVPAGMVARGLIGAVGLPLAAPSANQSNGISPTRAEHVLADLAGRIELVLDGGPAEVGLESTVLDLSEGPPYRVLRPGPIGALAIAEVLGREVVEGVIVAEGLAASPGQRPVHYAPTTPAYRVEAGEDLLEIEGAAVVVVGAEAEGVAACLPEPVGAARELYRVLRELDGSGARAIVVVMPPDWPEWRAVRDRLARATREWR